MAAQMATGANQAAAAERVTDGRVKAKPAALEQRGQLAITNIALRDSVMCPKTGSSEFGFAVEKGFRISYDASFAYVEWPATGALLVIPHSNVKSIRKRRTEAKKS